MHSHKENKPSRTREYKLTYKVRDTVLVPKINLNPPLIVVNWRVSVFNATSPPMAQVLLSTKPETLEFGLLNNPKLVVKLTRPCI